MNSHMVRQLQQETVIVSIMVGSWIIRNASWGHAGKIRKKLKLMFNATSYQSQSPQLMCHCSRTESMFNIGVVSKLGIAFSSFQ